MVADGLVAFPPRPVRVCHYCVLRGWRDLQISVKLSSAVCIVIKQRVRVGAGEGSSHARTYGHTHARSSARVHTQASVSQQHASVSQGRICSDNFTCCHTETEVADQTFYLTQSQYTDTGPTSPSADPFTPGAWQGNHWSANFFKSLV